MLKYTIFCFITIALFVFSSIGTTLASTSYVDDSIHKVNMASIKARIIEEYEIVNNVFPGNTIDKTVNVKNTGNGDIVVRVKVEKAWGVRGYDGKLIADSAYPSDNIIIDYNKEYWYYDEKSGYFYYKGVLKPGETTLAPLFENFVIDKNTGNEYQGLEADIIIKMECVQAAGDGVSIWGKTMKEIGIPFYIADTTALRDVNVAFMGGDIGFVFDPADTDLFANFNNLMPGETRSQVIEVRNSYDTRIEIFLRAEDIGQFYSDAKTISLLNKLLREYATIVITDINGNVIYNGPIWGEPYSGASSQETMRYNISLGSFEPGEVKILNILLQIDPAMSNEYQELLGLIHWVWSAELFPAKPDDKDKEPDRPVEKQKNETPKTVTPNAGTPKTGDMYNLWMWAGLTAISLILLIISFVLLVKTKRQKAADYKTQ